ncbi:MAG TPA: hypothetical protein VER55_14915 [Ardenticatenaceae bacterium]|nr:hypothetical protein [Ardenticatenaceae bacterium]
MYARVTTARFQPGAAREALDIFETKMLAAARQHEGFRRALVLQDGDQAIIITVWHAVADLEASAPPPNIMPFVERFGALIAEGEQHVYAVAGVFGGEATTPGEGAPGL